VRQFKLEHSFRCFTDIVAFRQSSHDGTVSEDMRHSFEVLSSLMRFSRSEGVL